MGHAGSDGLVVVGRDGRLQRGGYLPDDTGLSMRQRCVIAPFEYVAMPFALLWGYWLYAEVPSANTLFGIVLIVASGIYVAHRELVVRRRKGSQ